MAALLDFTISFCLQVIFNFENCRFCLGILSRNVDMLSLLSVLSRSVAASDTLLGRCLQAWGSELLVFSLVPVFIHQSTPSANIPPENPRALFHMVKSLSPFEREDFANICPQGQKIGQKLHPPRKFLPFLIH